MADVKQIELQVTYHRDQRKIFDDESKYKVIRCGRRYGKTKGAYHKMFELCLERTRRVLWVDTTQGNIEKYFDEHLHPLLKQLLKGTWHWNKQQKVLKLGKSLVHFGSAERPENLEGFGYDLVILNEAGIILKGEGGEKLWNNTLRPMTIEGKGADVWFIGTPKGLGLFKEFSERGRSDDPKWKDWSDYHRSSYDNPTIRNSEIDKLCKDLPPSVVRQEIYADFMEDDDGNPICPYELVKSAFERENPPDEGASIIWGVDPAQGGDDDAALVKRQGNRIVEPSIGKSGFSSLSGAREGAEWIYAEWLSTPEKKRPDVIMVDVIGLGVAWFTELQNKGLPVQGVNVSQRSHNIKKWERKRDQLWCKTAEWLETGSITGDQKLRQELIKPLIDNDYISKQGGTKIESKEKMKKRLGNREGSSPNRADALIITFDYGIERKESRYDYQDDDETDDRITWMGAW